MIPLLQTRRHDADHAPVPVLARQDNAPVARRIVGLLQLRLRLKKRLHFHRLPLAIVAIQFGRDLHRLGVVISLQQAQGKHRVPQPSAGIKPRTEPETNILRRDGKTNLAHLDQRAQSGPKRVFELAQPAPNQDAVLLHQRNDVGPRCPSRPGRDNRAGQSCRSPPRRA